MAADPRQGLSSPAGSRRLSPAASSFYARVYGSARNGSLAELRSRGCSEEEAEEFFQTAFERVMESVDPIAREFSAPQMVNFIKRAAWRCMIDERRRRGQRPEVELGTILSLSDASAESPEEVAEEREAIAIGREALEMLSERDRLIFRQRHQMNLSPDEILQNMPGLSLRTYRKIIQRANTRVLDAFERIEGGARCEEMEGSLLRRYVAEESPEAERLQVVAHLAHCRACQKAQARMRGYLFDLAGVLVAASSLPSSRGLGGLGDLPARLADVSSSGAQRLLEASRAVRERIREMVIRIAGGMPGAGGDATVGQAVAATSVKVVSACAAGAAAVACVAAGVVPGVGGLGLLSKDAGRTGRPIERSAPALERPSLIDTLPSAPQHAPKAESRQKRSKGGGSEAPAPVSRAKPSTSEPSQRLPSSPSEAVESGSVTGSEFGAESGQPVSPPSPPQSTPPSSPSTGGGSSGGSSQGGSSEFGL